MQVSRIGRVAPQSEGLSSPWRRPLPRHRILHRGFKCSAVWWCYLQGHFHLPGANRRKREFFGMNHPGDAHQSSIAGRRACRLRCAHGYEYCACRHYRGGKGEFHDVFPSGRGLKGKTSDDLVDNLLGARTKIKTTWLVDSAKSISRMGRAVRSDACPIWPRNPSPRGPS
jgi:hypothetical protein